MFAIIGHLPLSLAELVLYSLAVTVAHVQMILIKKFKNKICFMLGQIKLAKYCPLGF